VSTWIACAYNCLHISLVFGNTSPLPFILRPIWKHNICCFQLSSTKISVCNYRSRRSILSSKRRNTLILKELKIHLLAPHRLDRIRNLKPSKLRTYLPHPLSHIRILIVDCYTQSCCSIPSCSEISISVLQHKIVLCIEISCWEEATELSTIAFFNHTAPDISKIIQKLSWSQSSGIKLSFDCVCSVSSSGECTFDICIELLYVHRTTWIDCLCT